MTICDRVDELLEPWLDGELAAAEAREVEEHLETHPACAERAAEARRLRDALRELPELDAPPALIARIKRQAGRQEADVTVGPWRRITRPAVLLAASVAAAVLTVWVAPSPEPPGPSAAEVRAAAEEVRLALALVAQAGSRAGSAFEKRLSDGSGGAAGAGLRQALAPLRHVAEPPETPSA